VAQVLVSQNYLVFAKKNQTGPADAGKVQDNAVGHQDHDSQLAPVVDPGAMAEIGQIFVGNFEDRLADKFRIG